MQALQVFREWLKIYIEIIPSNTKVENKLLIQ